MTTDPLTPEQEAVALERSTRIAMLAVDHFFGSQPLGLHLPEQVRQRVAVHAAIGFLIGQGLLVPATEEAWRRSNSLSIPPHLIPDVLAIELQERQKQRQQITRLLGNKGGHGDE